VVIKVKSESVSLLVMLAAFIPDGSFYLQDENTFVEEGSCEDESEASACSPRGIRSNCYRDD
jgi:hypothetical protein